MQVRVADEDAISAFFWIHRDLTQGRHRPKLVKQHRSCPELDTGNEAQHFGEADGGNAEKSGLCCAYSEVKLTQKAA